MSASDLRKALESDEALVSYWRLAPGSFEFTMSQMRADILALIEEHKEAVYNTRLYSPDKLRLDGYVQAALTGYLAGNLDSGDAVLHGPEAVVFIAKEIMAEVDKSIGETK